MIGWLYALSIVCSSPTVAQQNALTEHEDLKVEQEPEGLQSALLGGRFWLDMRYRFEHVDSDAFANDADASTLRTVLGYESRPYKGARAFIEFEDVSELGEDNFNDTVNGLGDHPVIADPRNTEVNQVYLGYYGFEDFEMLIGRQEVALGNHRFIGNVAWRQNHQSYDALRLISSQLDPVTIDYSLLYNVNRIFGEDNPAGDERMASHLLNIGLSESAAGELTAYAYLLDFQDTEVLTTNTFGARLAGSAPVNEDSDVYWVGEYAKQVDGSDNPVDVDADYYRAELGFARNGWKLSVGNEHLGGSGDPGDKFSTPLATLHAFNGFADLFLNTPDAGLEDRFVTLQGKVEDVSLRLTYHKFESDTGSIDYGSEIDFDAVIPLTERIKLGLRYADFQSDEAFADTSKAMAWVSFRLL